MEDDQLLKINQNSLLQKQFKKYQTINRILDSQPETLSAKDQKMRSLTILLKREFDQNKILNQEIACLKLVNQTLNTQIQTRSKQTQKYQKQIGKEVDSNAQKTIIQRKQKLYIQQLKQQLTQAKQVNSKMENSHKSTLISMQSQINFLKTKTLQSYQTTLTNNAPFQTEEKTESICKKYESKGKKQVKRQLSKSNIKLSSRPATQRTVSFSQKRIVSQVKNKENNTQRNTNSVNKLKSKEQLNNQENKKQILLEQKKQRPIEFSFDNYETARNNFMKNVQNLPHFKGGLKNIQLEGCKFY